MGRCREYIDSRLKTRLRGANDDYTFTHDFLCVAPNGALPRVH